MVAENKKEVDKQSVPTFDAKDVVTWSKKDEDLLDEEKAKSSWLGTTRISSTRKQCIC
jgi:hypothetical protein